MNLIIFKKRTEGKINKKKNYEKAKQNPFRFLAKKEVLIPLNVGGFFFISIIANFLADLYFQLKETGLRGMSSTPTIQAIFTFRIIQYPFFYLGVYAFFVFVAVKITYMLYTSFNSLEEELVQGTLEWETVENLLNQYSAIPVNPLVEGEDYYPGKPGYPISCIREGSSVVEQESLHVEEDINGFSKEQNIEEEIATFVSEKGEKKGSFVTLDSQNLSKSMEELINDAAIKHNKKFRPAGKPILLYEETVIPESTPRKFYYLVAQEPANSIVLALTRGGKDVYFINPFLDILSRAERQEDRPSFVMTATKGDEPRMWYQTLKNRGYDVRICNTVRQYYSDPYNPLSIVLNYYKKYIDLQKTNKHESARFLTEAENELRRSAATFFQSGNGNDKHGDFWVKACRNLFMSAGLAIVDQVVRSNESIKFNPYSIYNVVNEMHTQVITKNDHDFLKTLTTDPMELREMLEKYEEKTALDVFFKELPKSHPAKKYYYAILASANAQTTLGNVITHFDGDLEMFLNDATVKMSATDDGFDFEQLGFNREKPTACFVVLSQVEKSNNALGMLYLEQAYQVNEKRCTLETPSRTYRDIHFIIQEAGNLGVAIQNLSNKWTSGLGQGLFFHLVLQDLEQLTEMYGEATKKTIVGNTGNLMYIRSGSLDTNNYISERLGKRSNYSKTRQKDPTSLKSTETEQSERIGLKEAFELERLMKSETILLRLSHVDDLSGEPIYQNPIYNSIENETNMLPFYEYRKNKVLSWDEIPVNNSFMDLDIEDLLVTLDGSSRKKEDKKKTPQLITKKTRKTKAYAESQNMPEPPVLASDEDNIDDWPDVLPSPIPSYKRKKREVRKGEKETMQQGTLIGEKEMLDAYNKAKEKELQKKQNLHDQLKTVLPIGYEQLLVKDFFDEQEIRELTIRVRIAHLGNTIVLEEFKSVCEKQDLGSFISFVSSNDRKELSVRIIERIQKWKKVG